MTEQTKFSLRALSWADSSFHHRSAFKLLNVWLCTVDPPYAPLKDRMVSNVTLEGPMTAQQDYRFTADVTWKPPVYPYKTLSMYLVKWSRKDDGSFVGYRPSVSGIIFSITSLFM